MCILVCLVRAARNAILYYSKDINLQGFKCRRIVDFLETLAEHGHLGVTLEAVAALDHLLNDLRHTDTNPQSTNIEESTVTQKLLCNCNCACSHIYKQIHGVMKVTPRSVMNRNHHRCVKNT